MTKVELERIIEIVSTHDEGEGEYCDTGEDMEWGCRSECTDLAIKRLYREYSNGNI